MKTTVLCGSPKGNNSITLQTVRYLEKKFPDDSFRIFQVAQSWNQIERRLPEIAGALAESDLLLAAYPVYSFFPPAQMMHAWARLVREISPKKCFFTQITTSKKVFDPLAHRYFEQNAADWGLRVIPGLSADQDDLPEPRGQRDAVAFWQAVRYSVAHRLYDSPASPGGRLRSSSVPEIPEEREMANAPGRTGFDTLILTDCEPDDAELTALIARFRRCFRYPTRVFNIRNFPLAGGCLGCMKCMPHGNCIYRDGFEQTVKSDHAHADATVVAFSIRNHGLSPELKAYFDRTYFDGHRPPPDRKSIGYLVNGPLAEEPNLLMLLNAWTEFRHTCGCGVATNEAGRENSVAVLASRLAYSMENDLLPPRNFYGEACMKMFRDLVYVLRGVLRADHRYFQQKGLYDFPQDQTERIKASMRAGLLLSSPELERELGMSFLQAMVKDHRAAVARAVPEAAPDDEKTK